MDNKFFTFMGRVADLCILNIICLICCIPIVTAGASITAMYYVTLKMVRNEEAYIVRSFFKSFKENIKQAIALGKTVLPRIPVIPGFNDSLHDAEMFTQEFKELGIQRVHLLPFHQFGENKYSLLNKEYAYHNTTALHKEDLIPYQNIFLAQGIEAFF